VQPAKLCWYVPEIGDLVNGGCHISLIRRVTHPQNRIDAGLVSEQHSFCAPGSHAPAFARSVSGAESKPSQPSPDGPRTASSPPKRGVVNYGLFLPGALQFGRTLWGLSMPKEGAAF